MTPYEVWNHKKPTCAFFFFCIIGCVAHVKVVKPNLKRFEACSTPMIVVGSEFRAYRVYNLVSGLVYITRDIVFDETTKWAWLNQNNQARHLIPSNDFHQIRSG